MPLVLQSNWVGQRVSIRRAVRHPHGEGIAFSDVVGDLVALDADHAVVETRKGLVEVPVSHVAIAKLVPPSTRDELDLQAIIARGWVAAEQQPLGGWTLRANGGFTGRANSVLASAAVELAFEQALQSVRQWYAERGLPAKFQLAVEGRRLLDAELGERGWEPSEPVHVMTRRLAPPTGSSHGAVTVATRPSEEWFGLYRGGAGADPHARGLLLRHDTVAFAELRDGGPGGELVAVGRATIDDDWLGINAVEVTPAARRRGLATAVMAALTEWGAQGGAVRAHLEVTSSNEAAVQLYEGLGFHVHHDYRYRTEPDS